MTYATYKNEKEAERNLQRLKSSYGKKSNFFRKGLIVYERKKLTKRKSLFGGFKI